jgi:hypothetical protein
MGVCVKKKLRNVLIAVVGASALFLMAPSPGHAASPSEQNCTEAGGTFDRTQGEVSCTFVTVDPVGNSENSGGQSQNNTSADTDSSNGTLQNEPQFEESSVCVGPGNSGEGGGQCPG